LKLLESLGMSCTLTAISYRDSFVDSLIWDYSCTYTVTC